MAGVDFTRALTAQQEHDLIQLTAERYPTTPQLEVISANTQFHVVNRWWQKDKLSIESGTEYNDLLFFDRDGNAQAGRMLPGQPINRAIHKSTAKFSIPYVKAFGFWEIMHDETARNRMPSQLKSIVIPRRMKMQIDLAKQLEEDGFGSPDSAADRVKPFGLKYWAKPITADQAALDTQDHQGSLPLYSDNTTEAASCAGIVCSHADYALFRNYNARYFHDDIIGGFGEEDVLRIVRMHRHMEFEVPLIVDDWKAGKFSNYTGLVPEDLLETMEIMARKNNDNLQADLGKFSGQVVVKGTPLRWAKKLDTDWFQAGTALPSYPFILLNHDYFKVLIQQGEYFRTDEPMRDADTPDVWTNYTFCVYNYVITNRRLGVGVISVEPKS